LTWHFFTDEKWETSTQEGRGLNCEEKSHFPNPRKKEEDFPSNIFKKRKKKGEKRIWGE